MNRPTLSLCIPAYRAEAHIPRLLASAHAQSPPFDDIIVCVDGSSDRTEELAKAAGARVLVNRHNIGCSASKNRALSAAHSDWVHFHDADDVLLPGFTSEAQAWMIAEDPPDVVIMGFEYRDFETDQLLATGLLDDVSLATDPIGFTIRHKVPNFGIYRREPLVAIGGFDTDPAVLFNEDAAFHIRLAVAGLRFRASSVVTSINWRHKTSMSTENPTACLWSHYALMLKVVKQVPAQYRESIVDNLWSVAQGLASHRDWPGMTRVLRDAERVCPRAPSHESLRFRRLCSLLGTCRAFRVREELIRLLKPQLRPSAKRNVT